MRGLLLVLFIPFLFCSCTKDQSITAIHRPAACDSLYFSYTKDILPIISSNCSSLACHAPGGEGAYDFTQYEVLADRIRSGRVLYRLELPVDDPQHMPEGYTMDPCALFKLKTWIHQGFENN